MAITLVGAVTGNPGVHGGATGVLDTTVADLLVVSVSWWGFVSGAVATFSDSKGNTYTSVTQQGSGTATEMRQQFAYCFSPVVGTGHTFTVGINNGYPAIVVHAFSGAVAAGLIYQIRSGAGGSVSSPLATGSVTPIADGALLLTGYSVNNGTLPTGLTASGFAVTTRDGVGGVNFPGAAAYVVQPTAAAINPAWSWSSGSFETAASTVVFAPPPVDARVSQVPVEVLHPALAPFRLSQAPVEVALRSAPLRLSQAIVEVLMLATLTPPDPPTVRESACPIAFPVD